jgi:hypothetical protein
VSKFTLQKVMPLGWKIGKRTGILCAGIFSQHGLHIKAQERQIFSSGGAMRWQLRSLVFRQKNLYVDYVVDG